MSGEEAWDVNLGPSCSEEPQQASDVLATGAPNLSDAICTDVALVKVFAAFFTGVVSWCILKFNFIEEASAVIPAVI